MSYRPEPLCQWLRFGGPSHDQFLSLPVTPSVVRLDPKIKLLREVTGFLNVISHENALSHLLLVAIDVVGSFYAVLTEKFSACKE